MSAMTPAEQLKEKVAALQEALISVHPTMPVLLKTIHTQLRADTDLVTTLSEEEIAVIVNGLKQQTKTELATTMLKSGKTTKALKNIGVLDI